jgi:hypothetical protein
MLLADFGTMIAKLRRVYQQAEKLMIQSGPDSILCESEPLKFIETFCLNHRLYDLNKWRG